jgi:hypothetical protein
MLALQIALSTGQFSPGRYVCPGYSWVSATDPAAGAVHHFLGMKAAAEEYVCQTVHGTARRDAVAATISPQPGWEVSEPAEPGLDGASPSAASLRATVLAQGWDLIYHQYRSEVGNGGKLVESVSAVNPDSRSYEQPLLEAVFIDGQPARPLDGLLRQVGSRPRPHCPPAAPAGQPLDFPSPPGRAAAYTGTPERDSTMTRRTGLGRAGDKRSPRPASK